jgi:hypothetical protein
MSRHPFLVIPAKAGISPAHMGADVETPAFAGVTMRAGTAST